MVLTSGFAKDFFLPPAATASSFPQGLFYPLRLPPSGSGVADAPWVLLTQPLDLPGHPSSVQLLSRVRLFATPWTAARQASLSITNSWSLLKLMSIESVMPSNHLILCCPLLLLPSTFPSVRVFSNESVLCTRWPKYWSFGFSINEYQLQHSVNI